MPEPKRTPLIERQRPVPMHAHMQAEHDVDFDTELAAELDAARALSLRVLEALHAQHGIFEFQPVAALEDQGCVLYWECLTRVRQADGTRLSPQRFIDALERTGLIVQFDQFVLEHVIGLLEDNPALSLGCNVSARSANLELGAQGNHGAHGAQGTRDDAACGWQPILARLARDRTLAQRLVLEITETTQLAQPAGRAFVERVRSLGVSVALDDFGGGFALETGALLERVDIVKLDATLLSAARASPCGAAYLAAMAAHAFEHAPHVVLEGVEYIEDLRLALHAGVPWVQGFHVGQPALLERHLIARPSTALRSPVPKVV